MPVKKKLKNSRKNCNVEMLEHNDFLMHFQIRNTGRPWVDHNFLKSAENLPVRFFPCSAGGAVTNDVLVGVNGRD